MHTHTVGDIFYRRSVIHACVISAHNSWLIYALRQLNLWGMCIHTHEACILWDPLLLNFSTLRFPKFLIIHVGDIFTDNDQWSTPCVISALISVSPTHTHTYIYTWKRNFKHNLKSIIFTIYVMYVCMHVCMYVKNMISPIKSKKTYFL
jgi:hypothetical protein